MQFKKNEFRKQLLEQMEVPEETIRFLEGQNVPLLFEWSYFCAAEGMSVDILKNACEEAEKDRTLTSEIFKKERTRYLQESFENNAELGEKFDLLEKKVEDMFQRASSALSAFEETVKQSFRDKDKLYGDIIEAKERLIQDKDKQMKVLEDRIAEMKAQAKDKDDRIHFLEDRLKTAEIKLGSVERDSPSNPEETGTKEGEGTGYLLTSKEPDREKEIFVPSITLMREDIYPVHPGRRFLARKKERETELFIRQFMENKEYSNEQKEFLIRCLEQGDSMKFIREFASPSLSVEHMAWLRKIIGGRMRYGR